MDSTETNQEGPDRSLREQELAVVGHNWYQRLKQNPLLYGVAIAIVSIMLFALMSVIVKKMTEHLNPLQVVFLRNFMGLVCLMPWLLRMGTQILRTSRLRLHIIRAALGLTTMICWFFSLKMVPLAQAITLGFTKPFFALIIGAVVLHEVVHARRWVATIVGFIGVVMVVNPDIEAMNIWFVLPLVATVLATFVGASIKSLAKTESPAVIVVYMSIFLTPMSLIPALFAWVPMSLNDWLWAIAMGIVATTAQVLYAKALKHIDLSLATPLEFVQLPFTALMAWWIWQEKTTFLTWVGAAIIVASASYIVHREQRHRNNK